MIVISVKRWHVLMTDKSDRYLFVIHRKQLPSWETGYIAKNGPGVRLTFKEPGTNKELAVTFTCEDPNKIVELLTGAKG